MREGGVEALERESWNSGVWVGVGVGITTSSRHWFDFDVEVCLGLVMGRGPVGVSSVCVCEVGVGFGGTDWKAWMGRASKNSWAMMKGVLLGPVCMRQMVVLKLITR